VIAAILRAQWLSMRLTGRGAAFNILVGVIWYGLWSGVATLLGLAAATLPAGLLVQWLPAGFLGMFAYAQFVPVISASMGSALNLRKLLPYPIPHHRLFVIEVLLRLMNTIEMLMVLAGGMLGLLVNPETGGFAALPGVAAAAALFVLFNVLLASGLRSVLTRLFAMRKVRELMTLLVALVWVLPRVLVSLGLFPKTLGGAGILLRTAAFPWSAAAHLALGISPALGLVSLLGWTLAALWFGRVQFERSLRRGTEEGESAPVRAREGRTPLSEHFYRLPGLVLRDPVAGIVEKELRSLARTPRFRTIFVMGFTFGLLVWFPVMFREGSARAASPHYLVIVCGYALILMGQVSYWNCFGFDRSAAAFYFAAPQPVSKVLLGKNLASLCFIYLEVTILIGVTYLFRLSHGWGNALEALVVIGICALYMLALGNLSSVNYPRPLTPERVSQGGASGRFQGLVFLAYPVALLPVFLAYLARYALRSEIAFVVVLALAGVLGAGIYYMAMESAAHTATARREKIIQELSRQSGPVASE
jgi:ABC-2 type transport system permease protein